MRIVLFSILAVSILVSCSTLKSTSTSEDTTSTKNALLQRLGEDFGRSIISGETSGLKEYLPDVALAKILSPERTEAMTDEAIQSEMIDVLVSRFDLNLGKLQNAISENNIDRKQLSFTGSVLNPSDDPPLVPRVLSVNLKNGGEDVSIPVTVLYAQEKWYLFEILNTTNIFSK